MVVCMHLMWDWNWTVCYASEVLIICSWCCGSLFLSLSLAPPPIRGKINQHWDLKYCFVGRVLPPLFGGSPCRLSKEGDGQGTRLWRGWGLGGTLIPPLQGDIHVHWVVNIQSSILKWRVLPHSLWESHCRHAMGTGVGQALGGVWGWFGGHFPLFHS